MTSPPFTPKFRPPRDLARAVARGFRGRCPRCGQGRLLSGYISPVSECATCGEHLQPYQTADFAPYLVVFANGLIFTPIIVFLSMSRYGSVWLTVLLVTIALANALTLLPRAKGAAIALLWTLDIRANQ
jgi:uncharacterized protein (DUF983 family)